MAFQAGSTIRPELGNADYSGFARAGEIQGQALASFGAQIGQGIEKYKKNKEITAVTLASVEGSVAANPQYLENALAQGGKIGKAAQKLQEGDISRMDLLTLEGFFSTMTKVSQAETAKQDAALQRENLIARTEASRRSNQPTPATPVTYTQIQGVAKVMDEQFPEVNIDPATGALFVKNVGSRLNPLDNTNDPANLPEAITSLPGFEEWKKSKMSASARGKFDPSAYRMIANP